MTTADFDAKEGLRRARMILDNAEREIAAARAVLNENLPAGELASLLRATAAGALIGEYGAMFEDACNCTEPASERARTRKVRKAFGFVR